MPRSIVPSGQSIHDCVWHNADDDYQLHHTIGPLTSQQREAVTCPSDAPTPVIHATSHTVGGDATAVSRASTTGTTGAAYQRRAQFRITMEMYQGRPTRPVPPTVISEIRDQIEASARHLISTDATDPLERYARVTRVHVLSLLRTMGNNRWYRESHYIHATITGQPPPDISELQSTMMFMFGVRNFHCSVFFCFIFLHISQYIKQKKKNNVAAHCATRFPKNLCGGA